MTRTYKGNAHGRLSPELRARVKRLIALNAAHLRAIRADDDEFYTDGRHAELVALVGEVHPAIGIRPWKDADAKLAEALR